MKKITQIIAATALIGAALPALADNEDRIYQQNRSQYITHEQARDAALAKVPGFVDYGDVDFEYNRRHGAYFEVEVHGKDGKEYDVKVDAKTGKILNVREDW